MQRLFDSTILLVPVVIALLLWINLRHRWPLGHTRPQSMLLLSVLALSCNMLLLYATYVVDLLFMRKGPMSQATLAEYWWTVALMWCSRIAILGSLLTIISALLSERGRARNVCLLGGVVGLVWWPLVTLTNSELVSIYMRTHR